MINYQVLVYQVMKIPRQIMNIVKVIKNTMLVDEDLEFVDTSNIIHPADDVEAK
ncbi:4303_t:CDS:2 [Entrophospora sp. SA101]|nr:4303_t:CDS:2 [Entrophospora sp. SA101]